MRLLTETEVEAFIAAKPAAAIHFDAEWDYELPHDCPPLEFINLSLRLS